MTAEAPQISPISPLFKAADQVPAVGSKEWMRWFQNIGCTENFDKNTFQTDFSLQMSSGLAKFFAWRDLGSKINAERYKKNQKGKTSPVKVYEVRQTIPKLK